MKLSISNIAWENSELEEHLKLIKELGCDGVEIAPSCIWKEPVDASDDETESLKRLVAKNGLVISAFHALLFTRPELYLFGEESVRQDAVSYLKDLIRLAGKLSVGVLVFGSPGSRRVGDKSYDSCYKMALSVFEEISKEAELNNTVFCIEPLGPSESDFIQTADEGYELVKNVAHPNFGLHLDVKAMIDTGEDYQKNFNNYGSVIKHFHAGDPGLAPPGYTGFDHSLIGKALANSDYSNFVSIEMKRGFGNSKEVVSSSIEYVQDKYFLKRD